MAAVKKEVRVSEGRRCSLIGLQEDHTWGFHTSCWDWRWRAAPQLATNRTSVFRQRWWWWWWWWSLRDAAVLLTFTLTLTSAFIVKILTNACCAVRADRWAPGPEQTTEAQEEHLERGRPDVQVMNSGSDHLISSAPTQEQFESEHIQKNPSVNQSLPKNSSDTLKRFLYDQRTGSNSDQVQKSVISDKYTW